MNEHLKVEDNYLYKVGYEKGYKEGYSKALEHFQKELQLSIQNRPIKIVISKDSKYIK